jgi:hypothetical protein
MTSLSLIATEAHRLLGSLEEQHRPELQDALVALCEKHWQQLRGPQPATPLAQALWSVTPPWSDLLLDLHADANPRLLDALPGENLAKGLALLVLAEIEHGNEAGAHTAHEPMMAFESITPPEAWLQRLTALLRGTLEPPLLHKHEKRDALWKALAVIAAHTHRLDLPAVVQVIGLLTTPAGESATTQDEELETLRQGLLDVGICFLDIEDDHVQFELHGHAHKPVRTRHLGEMLQEIRQKWLH